MSVRRVTGLQRQIYSLYKRSLKLVAAKPVETRSAWFQFVSHHFRHPDLGGGLRSRDTSAIEYFLRRGEKMLDSYGSSTTTTVRVPETHHWPEGWVARGGKEAPKTGAPGPVRSGGKEGSGEGAK